MSSSPSKPQAQPAGRTALIGCGSRALLYIRALASRQRSSGSTQASLVALCDPNPVRAKYYNDLWVGELGGQERVPVYKPEEFERMLQKESVQTVVVCCVDSEHDAYVVKALYAGVRVITEKPMTTDMEKCRRILQACKDTGRHITVTFNYRYNPVHELVKRTLSQHKIGSILSIHFEWLLDTTHGADYFHRWHRTLSSSGGLIIHKASHHFDLVNWWIDACPVKVAGMGKLAFYGEGNQSLHGWGASGSGDIEEKKWSVDLEADDMMRALYAGDAQSVDGYKRDQDVFGPGITIQDDMSLIVKYDNGVTMTYHLTAYSPWEGYRVMFNGTHGRLELKVVESQFRLPPSGDKNITKGYASPPPSPGPTTLTLHPLWAKPYPIPIPEEYGHEGHGGGDERMLDAIFGAASGSAAAGGGGDAIGGSIGGGNGGEEGKGDKEAEKQSANERDGALALAVGLMANRSFEREVFVGIEELGLEL